MHFSFQEQDLKTKPTSIAWSGVRQQHGGYMDIQGVYLLYILDIGTVYIICWCIYCILLLVGPFVLCFSPLVGSLVASVLLPKPGWFGQELLNMGFPWILAQEIIISDHVY